VIYLPTAMAEIDSASRSAESTRTWSGASKTRYNWTHVRRDPTSLMLKAPAADVCHRTAACQTLDRRTNIISFKLDRGALFFRQRLYLSRGADRNGADGESTCDGVNTKVSKPLHSLFDLSAFDICCQGCPSMPGDPDARARFSLSVLVEAQGGDIPIRLMPHGSSRLIRRRNSITIMVAEYVVGLLAL